MKEPEAIQQIILNGDERDFLQWRWSSGGTVEIFDIAVGSDRRTGKGRELVELLIGQVRGKTKLVFAITRQSNAIAQDFYRGIGFRFLGRLKGFYDGEHAYAYGRDIT